MATIDTERLIRKGARGDEVRALQQKLHRLGFPLAADGEYGDATRQAVIQLQTLFGHPVDGVVSRATMRLIDTQIRCGWSADLPNAQELALRSQGKDFGMPTGRMGRDRATNQNVIEVPRSPSLTPFKR